MKKFLLFLVMTMVAISIKATIVDVYYLNGTYVSGTLIEQSNSVLIIRPTNKEESEKIIIEPKEVKYFHISGIGRYIVKDGMFVPTQQALARIEQSESLEPTEPIGQENIEQNELKIDQGHRVLANPYEVIGKAFKSTGNVCLGIGIPSIVTGGLLLCIGYSGVDLKSQEKCVTAGYVFLSTGAALTIISVPLIVHSKRIAELNVNYTGNGAGLALNF